MYIYLYEEVKLGCIFRWNFIIINNICLKLEMNKFFIFVFFFEYFSKYNRKYLVFILKKSNEIYENDVWFIGYNVFKRWKVVGNFFLLLCKLYFGM